MSKVNRDSWDDECSVIGDKGEIGFIDFEDDQSVFNYDADGEGPDIISIPFQSSQEKPQSILIGESSKCSITIRNSTSDPIDIWGIKIFCCNLPDSFTLSLMEPLSASENTQGFLGGFSIEDTVLQPLQTSTIWLSCKPKNVGLHTTVD